MLNESEFGVSASSGKRKISLNNEDIAEETEPSSSKWICVEDEAHEAQPCDKCGGISTKSEANENDLSNDFNKDRSIFTCKQCHAGFETSFLLECHILERHDSYFKVLAEQSKTKHYVCLVESCGRKFRDAKKRKLHLVSKHEFGKDFDFYLTGKKGSRKIKTSDKNSTAAAKAKDGDVVMSDLEEKMKRINVGVPVKIQFGRHQHKN